MVLLDDRVGLELFFNEGDVLVVLVMIVMLVMFVMIVMMFMLNMFMMLFASPMFPSKAGAHEERKNQNLKLKRLKFDFESC